MSTTRTNHPIERAALAHDYDAEQQTAVEVLIVDDDRAASYCLWALLDWRPGVRVCATAENAADAARAIGRLRPDLCLVAAALGTGAGLRLCHAIGQLAEPPHVLVYSDRAGEQLEGAAVIAGADGAVSRYGDPDRLERTIKRIVAGDLVQQTSFGASCIGDLIDRVEDRDRAIAAMLLERVPPDQIAHTLGISASSFRLRHREIVKRIADSPGSQPVWLPGRPPAAAPRLDGRRSAREVPKHAWRLTA